MRSDMDPTRGASPLGFLRFACAVVAFAALTLCGNVTFADDEPAEAAKPAASDAAGSYSGCSAPDKHPQDDPTVCDVKKQPKAKKQKTGTEKKQPVKLGVQIWGYTPPPDASGPEWQLRFTIAPVIVLPWKK